MGSFLNDEWLVGRTKSACKTGSEFMPRKYRFPGFLLFQPKQLHPNQPYPRRHSLSADRRPA